MSLPELIFFSVLLWGVVSLTIWVSAATGLPMIFVSLVMVYMVVVVASVGHRLERARRQGGSGEE
jgi:ABC-type uncharacterized transport system fused permease/ATPase subunit